MALETVFCTRSNADLQPMPARARESADALGAATAAHFARFFFFFFATPDLRLEEIQRASQAGPQSKGRHRKSARRAA
jgi:hypothetical protein